MLINPSNKRPLAIVYGNIVDKKIYEKHKINKRLYKQKNVLILENSNIRN